MKRRLLFAGAALSWFAASLVSLKGQGGTGAVMREARVTQVVKDVKILPSQAAPRPATLSDTVRGDTAIRTGVESRAELTFGDLTIARLGANTVFSFNEGSRTVELNNGAILLRVPKGSGGTKIQTAAVTAAITGTTVIVEYHKNSYAKYLVLEGTMRIYLKGVLGESVLLHAGQMMILNPNATRLSEPVDFDLERLLQTSLFIQGYPPLPSVPLLTDVKHQQLELKANGELIDTNLVIFGRGTLVTLTDPQSSDVIDRKTAAVTLPTPTAVPIPSPTPTAIPSPSPTPTAVPSPSPTPTAIPSPSPTPTPPPTPSKFGTPPPIVTFVPYPIDNGTAIQTDPAITRAGVTDFGKIYRDAGQDGAFSTWAFTATTPFDNSAGIDLLYGANVPVAAFKFTSLQLEGNPAISTANGGATNLALISVGPITSAPTGNATFTFTGMQSVLIATQNGSISLTGLTFQNIPLLVFYARGASSTLALASSPIANVQSLRLLSEGVIQFNSPISLQNGVNGGTLTGISGGTFFGNGFIDTPTGSVPAGTFVGAGGIVSLSATNGLVNANSPIQVSYNDAGAGRHSASGGTISLNSSLTTGTGISASSNLLSLLNLAAPGPGGSITLTTQGADIISNGATIQADRGTITIETARIPSVGTAQITLNGGAIQSETLTVYTRGGDLTIGNTTPVNLFAVSLSLRADRNVSWSGGTQVATANASPGYANLEAGNDLTITGATDIERSNGGAATDLSVTLRAGRNMQTAGLTLRTDGSGMTNGGNIFLIAGSAMNIGGAANLNTGPSTANQGNGSSIQLLVGGPGVTGPLNVGTLLGTVTIGAGRTLGSGGNIQVAATGSFTATQSDGGLSLQINNSAPGSIGTGGNITLSLGGDLTTNASGAFNLAINNQGGQIQTGANINADIKGNILANFLSLLIDNRFKGFIGTGGNLTLNVNGTLKVASEVSFEILNSQMATTGGTITSPAAINVTAGATTIGKNLNAFIDNSDGSIGPSGNEGTVKLQINGTLTVSGQINVFGTLNATGAISASKLSATDVTSPSIAVGGGGITRFAFPNELTFNPLHTITTSALTSTGGINFNGPDFDNPPGFGPFAGGQLTINVPSLTFGPSGADNIQGSVTFNGGSSPNNSIPVGDGGTFTVNATGAITVNNPITATTGLGTPDPPPSGTGGNVNLNTTNGPVSISATIKVSSNDTPKGGVPIRKSNAGGKINVQSNIPTGTAINISNTGQLLSLLDAAAAGPGGKITVLATGTNSRVQVNGDTGSAGTPPIDTIRADGAGGTVDIRHTGSNGTIVLTNAQISADTVKIGALGTNGTLTIGGGRINADTLLQLYATGSNGSVVFISNVLLDGNSMKIIAGNTVTVQNNVDVEVGGPHADVYVSDLNHANYAGFNGGNGTTSGRFIEKGSSGSPVSGASTHFGPPPPPPFNGGH